MSEGGQGSVFDQSAQGMQQAGNTYGNVAQGGQALQSMNAYLNPYQSQVIDNTTGRMLDQRDQNLNMIRGQAAGAGAFGGSRHGLVEAQAYEDSNRNIAEMQNQMNMQGFNTAAGYGLQDVSQQLQGAGGLTGTAQQGFNMGRALTSDQARSGQQQQDLMNSILQAGNQQFGGYVNHPFNMLNQQLAALAGNPLSGESITTTNPGLLDYLSVGMQGGGALMTGKGNMNPMGKI